MDWEIHGLDADEVDDEVWEKRKQVVKAKALTALRRPLYLFSKQSHDELIADIEEYDVTVAELIEEAMRTAG
jgi:hypothetical protein